MEDAQGICVVIQHLHHEYLLSKVLLILIKIVWKRYILQLGALTSSKIMGIRDLQACRLVAILNCKHPG